MKKALLFLCLAAGLMSCAQEILNTEKETPKNEGAPMTFHVTVLETKAAKADWADGDKIYVFFNGLETKYLVLERSNGSWTDTSGGGTLLDSDFSGLGTKALTAVHFPVAVDVTFAEGKFSFASGGKPVYHYYLFEAGKTYTVDGTTVSTTLSMGKPVDMVQIHVAGIESSVANYTFGCSKIRPVACKSVGTDGAITEDVLQAGARLSGFADSDGGVFAGRLTSSDVAADYVFTVASDDNRISTATTVPILLRNFMASHTHFSMQNIVFFFPITENDSGHFGRYDLPVLFDGNIESVGDLRCQVIIVPRRIQTDHTSWNNPFYVHHHCCLFFWKNIHTIFNPDDIAGV